MIKKTVKILLLLLMVLLVLFYLVKRPAWVNATVDEYNHEVKPELLQQHVKHLSLDLKRSHTDMAGLNAASQYIQQQFILMGLTPVEQTYTVAGHSYHNIVVSMGPKTGDVIVVGAHYDAYGSLPGADDNASGVAGLLELARLLQANQPSQAIELVAYTLEEPPYFAGEHMGSYVHAQAMTRKIKLMISLEMIGYFTENPDSQQYPTVLMQAMYPNQGNFIAVVDQLWSTQGQQLKNTLNRMTGVDAYSINAPAWIPGVDFSDHRNYWAKDIPAVMVTDTSFYRNKNYHTEFDTYEKLDYDKMSQVIWGVYKHITK